VTIATAEARLEATDLVDRLAAHQTLGSAPRKELEWLAAHGEFRRYGPGDIASSRNTPATEMIILLTGHVSLYVERGTGRRHVMDSRGGDVAALLPYSRGGAPPGDVLAVEPTEILAVHRDQFPELIRDCPAVTEILVHVMLDRARLFALTTVQDDRMAALGRLAAGLAHELNNPASAAARSSTLLAAALSELRETSRALGAAHLTEAQRAHVEALSDRSLIPPTSGVFSALERSDREDEITRWLEGRGADLAPAQALGESGITPETLDELAESFNGEALNVVLRSVAAEYTARSLAADVARATSRIHDLVSAVKRFSYMDRAAVAEPTDVGQGLTDTVGVLATKAKAKSVGVRLDLQADLPFVPANAADLIQVRANLLENAMDAVGQAGQVIVTARREGNEVVVRVVDDGPGIPASIQDKIFDPFFTTKPVGQGTGLGLDITRRTVQRFGGQIAVDTRPARTEFRVTLPLQQTGAQ